MSGLGEVLGTLRLARGLTQEDLSAQTGLTQAALSRYEHDLRQPSPTDTERLAAALGVTPEFLTRAARQAGAMAVDAHMRRRATAKATDWRKFEARLNEYRMHASHLFEEVSLQAGQIVPRFDAEDPADAARLVRMQWHMPVGPVRTLFRWLESAGCLLFEEDFGTPRIDGMSQWMGDHPVMLLNVVAPTDRKRLTAAHELGHLVLHSEFVSGDVEQEANQFAAEFLMPAEAIRYQLRQLTIGKLADLKREWGVSMAALVERAFALGTVTAQERVRLYKTFSARGIRINEPGSSDLPPERAELAHHLGASLLDKGLDRAEIAHLAGYDTPDQVPFFAPTRGLRIV